MAVVRAPEMVQKMSQLREGSLRGRLGRPIIRRAGFWVEAGGLGAEVAVEDTLAGAGFYKDAVSVSEQELGHKTNI